MVGKLKISALVLLGFISFSAFSADDGIEHYEKLYQQGDSVAAYKLGLANYYGIDGIVNPSKNKAIKYLDFADKNGHVRASTILGIHYFESNVNDKALNHFKKAAAKGELLSMAYLAKMIEKEQPDEAERLYRRALTGKSPKSYQFFGEFLVNNSKAGTVKFLMGYALLINLKTSGKDSDMSVDRFFRINPYRFTKAEGSTLNQLIQRNKFN